MASLVLSIFAVMRPSPAPEQKSGATSVQVTDGDCIVMNGLHRCFYEQPFRTASSTVCSFKLPTATSTVASAGMVVNVASTTGQTQAEIGIGAGNNATTTSLGLAAFQPATDGVLDASTTSAALQKRINKVAGNYLNFNIGGGIVSGDTAGTGFVPNGMCTAEVTY